MCINLNSSPKINICLVLVTCVRINKFQNAARYPWYIVLSKLCNRTDAVDGLCA